MQLHGNTNSTGMKLDLGSDNQQATEVNEPNSVSRRNFLQLAGGIAGAGIFVASCRPTPNDKQFIGRGDTALLNYLYIVELVLAAFYAQANNTQYYGLTESELQLLPDMREHQYAHRELLKKMLGSDLITKVFVDLSQVTYADRNSVLTNATFLEDLAVAAYNGVAQYFSNTNFVLLTAKMATVQARHAAYARDIHAANTFSDSTVVNLNGLDRALSPQVVMQTLTPWFTAKIDYSTLPS